MSDIIKISAVHDFNALLGVEDQHPLVSVIDFSAYPPRSLFRALHGVYGIFLREDEPDNIVYGCSQYGLDKGTLIAIAPGQVGGSEDTGYPVQRKGWALLFHPDLLRGTTLGTKMKKYTFFSYEVNEALHVQADERATIVSCLRAIQTELDSPADAYSQSIIVAYIEVLLNHCMRFYGRQFAAQKAENRDLLMRFDRLLTDYYSSGEQYKHGIPGVQKIAEQLAMSANYFSDLVKRATGETPSEHIRRFLVDRSKELLADQNKTVSEVAYELGFNYPHHLSRLFKNSTGMSPTEYVAALKL